MLGTDGFGRSDTRARLRGHFEVDYRFIVLSAIKELADAQVIPAGNVVAARDAMGIEQNKPNPLTA